MWVLYIPHHIHDSGVGLEEALTIGGMENCNLYLISTNNKKKSNNSKHQAKRTNCA